MTQSYRHQSISTGNSLYQLGNKHINAIFEEAFLYQHIKGFPFTACAARQQADYCNSRLLRSLKTELERCL